MADNFGLKIGLEGEKEFKKALTDINYNGELTSEVRYSKEELSDSSNINKTYDLIKKIHLGY